GVTKKTDPLNNSTTIEYSDRFGSADGEARSNSQVPAIATYAFPTSSTNALGFTEHSQFDYYTGLVVDSENINNPASSIYYNSNTLKPRQFVNASNLSDLKTQTTLQFGPQDLSIQASSDIKSFNDNKAKILARYDGMGRMIEERTYKGSIYSSINYQYD